LRHKSTMSPSDSRELRAVLFAIALAGLAVRVIPVIVRGDVGWAMEPNGDSATYLGLADGLRRGCGFTRWNGENCRAAPETYRTPGYPLFLSVIPGLRIALAAQGLLWSFLCFAIGLFTAKLAGNRAGYCTAGLIAADVPSVVSSDQIMSEILFTALVVCAVLAELETLRNPQVGGTGFPSCRSYYLLGFASAMLGMALLVRPLAEALIPLAILALAQLEGISYSRKALLGLMVVAGPVLLGTSWILRNHWVAGVNALSTIGDIDFFYYRAVGTLAFASHAGWAQTLTRTPPLPNADLSAQAWRIVLHHPFAFVAMTLWSFLYLCLVPDVSPLAQFLGMLRVRQMQDPGSVRIENLIPKIWAGNFAGINTIYAKDFHSSVILLLLVTLQLVMIAFIWAGVGLSLKRYAAHRSRRGACIRFAFAMAVLILLVASGPEAVARFRIPATPLLAMLAGIGWFGTTREQ
jgi:hypothetical protein